MMECDEIVDYIDAAEFALASLRKLWERNQQVPVLAVAAFAYAQMSHEHDDHPPMQQCAELFRMVVWVEELRKGFDPRCNLCKQNGALKLGRHQIHEVLQ